MADLSRIRLPSGNEYDIKDTVARSLAAGGLTFKGISDTMITDNSLTTSYYVNNELQTAQNGDLIIYNKKEFVYSSDDEMWHELGDNTAFGTLAYQNSVSTNYTPSGSVSAPTFTGTQASIEVTGTPAGTVAISAQTGVNDTNYTPEGTVSKPNVNVSLASTSKYVADSATGGGSVTSGTAASCTLPSLTMTVTDETLNFSWTPGSFTANTPTAVTMPTFAAQTIATGVEAAALDAVPAFTGTAAKLAATFTGSSMSATGSYTPEGNNSTPTFTGTQAAITVEA